MAAFVLAGIAACVWLDWNSNSNITLTISSKQQKHKLGDPILINYIVKNEGESTTPNSHHWYERIPYLGSKLPIRIPTYYLTLSAVRENGTWCTRPWWPAHYSLSLLDREIIELDLGLLPGESCSGEVTLNDQAILDKAGRYSISGCVMVERDIGWKWESFVDSATIEIKVEQRSHKEMRTHIDRLVQVLEASVPSEAGDAVKQLMYTRDSRVVPAMVDFEYREWLEERDTDVGEALCCYLPLAPEIKNILLQAAKSHGTTDITYEALQRYCTDAELRELITTLFQSTDPNCVASAALLSSDYPDNAHTYRLIELAQDSSSQAQFTAISALAYNRTEEGVEALRELMEGNDEDVVDYTAASIWNAYSYLPWQWYEGPCHELSKRELTSIVADPNSPQRWDAIEKLLYRMDYADFRVLKRLANAPGRNAEIKGSRETVKLIANILKSPDEVVRDIMITLIRLTARMDPERQLKPDDFREIYEQYE